MIVYHGSSIKVQLPDIYHSRGNDNDTKISKICRK